jgi:hypothetical protein
MAAPPMISQVVFILRRNNKIAAKTNNAIVKISVRENIASSMVTLAIKPKATALTPSNIPLNQFEARNRGTQGLIISTNMKEGKKMATVANTAPCHPLRMKPTKVAVVNTGPGVTCPTATASISC